jgi:hypothetical protein
MAQRWQDCSEVRRTLGTGSLGSQSSRPCGLIAKSCCCGGPVPVACCAVFEMLSVLVVLVTAYEIIASAVLRSAPDRSLLVGERVDVLEA